MYKITKEFGFEAAHLLENHGGECINLHGHSYRIKVTLSSDFAQNGMVLDFSDLKKTVADAVIFKIDHAFIFNTQTTDAAEKEIAGVLKKHGRKVYGIKGRATTENMAAHFFKELRPLFVSTCQLLSVEVYETPTSFCEFSE